MPALTARSVPALLQTLVADDPTAPRLTFYGEGYERTGERVELSARVLSTWVAKTANLLEEEFEAGPGTRVALDLPVHWRALVWQLAVWSTGAHVLTGAGADGGADADVLVSCSPEVLAGAGARDAVAVALAPLATSFGSGLPGGVLDYARVVTGYGDAHAPLAVPAAGDGALDGVAHGSLLAGAVAAGEGWPSGVRVVTDVTPAEVVRGPLAAWCRGGSVVLAPDLALLPGRVAEQERVDVRVPRG